LQPFFIASKHHIMHQNATKISVIRPFLILYPFLQFLNADLF